MSRLHSVSAFATSLTLIGSSCWFVTDVLPFARRATVVADQVNPPAPVRVGAGVMTANLISQGAPPVYPPLAKQAGVQGTVQFEALIGKDGLIKI